MRIFRRSERITLEDVWALFVRKMNAGRFIALRGAWGREQSGQPTPPTQEGGSGSSLRGPRAVQLFGIHRTLVWSTYFVKDKPRWIGPVRIVRVIGVVRDFELRAVSSQG